MAHVFKHSKAIDFCSAEAGLEKARKAAQLRVDAHIRHKLQQEGSSNQGLKEAQASARRQLFNKRQRQRAVAHAINQLLKMSEDAKSLDTADKPWDESVHVNRAV